MSDAGQASESDELERRAVELLRQNKDGVLQTDLWKSLGISSRDGSRLVLRLMRKGLVKREEVTVNGRRTYKVYLVEAKGVKFRLLVDISSVLDIPCVKCPHLNECGLGGYFDPSSCALLESWLKKETLKLRAAQRAVQA